jgi:hypothetical protein
LLLLLPLLLLLSRLLLLCQVWKLPKGLDDRDVSLLSSGRLAASNTPSQVGPSSPAGAMVRQQLFVQHRMPSSCIEWS